MRFLLPRIALAVLLFIGVTLTPGRAAEQAARKYFLPMISKAPTPVPGTLKADVNPVESGGSVNVSWNIPNFKSGLLDKGDGQGLQTVLTASGNLAIGALSSKRTVRVQWQDTANRIYSDALTLYPMTRRASTLAVNTNPTRRGRTATASWWLPDFANGDFDKGDGQGYKGPITANMLVDIANWQGARTLKLRWRSPADDWYFDTLDVGLRETIAGDMPACNPGNPDWRGADPPYQFCVRQDLEWADGGAPTRRFEPGKDRLLTMRWAVYGISGIRLKIEPSAQLCGPAGPDARDVPVNGSDGANDATYTFNARDFRFGGYKIELFVTRGDGTLVGYNEKFMCMGT